MNKFILLAFFLIFFLIVRDTKAQSNSTKSDSLFTTVSEPPSFIGDYIKFLRQNMVYPSVALDKNIQGKVIISCIVEKDGTITDLKVIKPVHPLLDEEALRAMGLTSRKWKPGADHDKTVRFKNTWLLFLRHLQIQKSNTSPRPASPSNSKRMSNLISHYLSPFLIFKQNYSSNSLFVLGRSIPCSSSDCRY